MFDVIFHAYCGMSYPVCQGVSLSDARCAIRARLRAARRRGAPVSRIGRRLWEIETPEDAGLIGDGDGILSVRRVGRSRCDC